MTGDLRGDIFIAQEPDAPTNSQRLVRILVAADIIGVVMGCTTFIGLGAFGSSEFGVGMIWVTIIMGGFALVFSVPFMLAWILALTWRPQLAIRYPLIFSVSMPLLVVGCLALWKSDTNLIAWGMAYFPAFVGATFYVLLRLSGPRPREIMPA